MTRLPAGAADRARAYLRGDLEPVVPQDAATVALLRDGEAGLEVYLLRRVAGMAFAPGMHVFPGGSVDPRDAERAEGWSRRWGGPPAQVWATRLGCPESQARALVCAAARETFEESGVLLAGSSGAHVVGDTTGADWAKDRLALSAHELAFVELLRRRSLVLRTDLLTAWARWVTPEFEPRRYDTRFFLAAVPHGQQCGDVSGEADEAVWLPVGVAVERHDMGTLEMLPPTVTTLRQVSAYTQVADVLSEHRTIRPLMPRPVLRAGELTLEWD